MRVTMSILSGLKETVIAEMVITITDTDVESHTAVEFLQVFFHICTMLNNKVDYIRITVSL